MHHATAELVMVNMWLPDPATDPDRMPTFANNYIGALRCGIASSHSGRACTHHSSRHAAAAAAAIAVAIAGVGGAVFNEKGEILVIVEKYNMIDAVPIKRWKVPGGLVEKNERMCTAIVREVMEETGVSAEFKGIVCIRHNLRYVCTGVHVQPRMHASAPCTPPPAASCAHMRGCVRDSAGTSTARPICTSCVVWRPSQRTCVPT